MKNDIDQEGSSAYILLPEQLSRNYVDKGGTKGRDAFTGEIAAGTGSVIILRALQLGDLMCAVPAFRSLRAALPQARITLVGLPWARSFVRRFNHYLDGFVEFPGYPGLPERSLDVARFPDFLKEVQRLESDLALQMQGSGLITNPLVALFGARQIAGFHAPGGYIPTGGQFLAYPEGEPEVWRLLRLIEHLGFPVQGDYLEFPIQTEDLDEFDGLRRKFGLRERSYAVLHPGARAEGRRWPVKRFADVGNELAARGLQVVLTGTREEAPLAQAVIDAMREPVVNLAGRTSLGGLAALLKHAHLLICNDTGVSHVAAAVQTPSVVLFSISDPKRWAPLNRRLHRPVIGASKGSAQAILAAARTLPHQEWTYVS